jgi:hypothetical protein
MIQTHGCDGQKHQLGFLILILSKRNIIFLQNRHPAPVLRGLTGDPGYRGGNEGVTVDLIAVRISLVPWIAQISIL